MTCDYNGSTYTYYEASQMQRAYERKIRESKRVLAGYDATMKETDNEALVNELKDAFSQESVKLKKTESAMKDFCKQTGRSVDNVRTQVVAYKSADGKILSFGRSTSQKAVWANRKASGQ